MADDDGNLKRGSGAADAPPKKGGKGVKAWVADHKGATVGIIGIIVTLILYERSKSSSTAAPAAGSGGAAQPAATGVGAGTSTPSVDPSTGTYDVSPNDPIIQALTQGETALQQQIAQVIASGNGNAQPFTTVPAGTGVGQVPGAPNQPAPASGVYSPGALISSLTAAGYTVGNLPSDTVQTQAIPLAVAPGNQVVTTQGKVGPIITVEPTVPAPVNHPQI